MLIGVSVIAPLPDAVTPETGPSTKLVHVKVVPVMLLVGVKFKETPLQIVACNWAAVLVITGAGETVTVTVIGVPLQPPADGVIWYTTVPLETPSVEVSTWLIKEPLPAEAPLTFVLV